MQHEPCIIRSCYNRSILISPIDEMLENRELELTSEITPDTAHSVIRSLRYLQRTDPKSGITLFIDSPGGLVDAGMAIYDTMNLLSCPVNTVCTGLAASMAAVLFIAGSGRLMLPHSRLMLHDPLISETGGSALRLKSISEDLMETREIIAAIISEHSNLSVGEVLAKTSSDTYFRADEAVRLGLADGISGSI